MKIGNHRKLCETRTHSLNKQIHRFTQIPFCQNFCCRFAWLNFQVTKITSIFSYAVWMVSFKPITGSITQHTIRKTTEWTLYETSNWMGRAHTPCLVVRSFTTTTTTTTIRTSYKWCQCNHGKQHYVHAFVHLVPVNIPIYCLVIFSWRPLSVAVEG